VIILLLILRSHNHPAYRVRLLERLGLVSKSFKQNGIIVHASSVGEVIALKPFIEQLLNSHPDVPITLTTFTPTGSAQVKKMFNERVQHCYLPLDIFPCTWIFLNKLQPQIMVLMETELWPNLITQCHQQQIKLQLINGRLSDNSMKSYRKLDWLIRPCIQRFDKILTQSDDNQRNFLALGAKKEICHVSGNLKFDLEINPETELKQQVLKEFIKSERQVWLVASTHPGDEELILTSFKSLKEQHKNLLLILVPRHPERFDSIFQLCQAQGFNTIRRSKKEVIKEGNDIWLIDTLGELLPAFSLADIVTMGGSFSTIGGHNPLEPALFKKAIVVGHDMTNFRKVMEQLSSKSGIEQINTNNSSSVNEQTVALTKSVNRLLMNKEASMTLGENAYKVVQENQGATAKSVKVLNELLQKC
jgi:3-deoxy-D-manno-octulosonic-acid transferase